MERLRHGVEHRGGDRIVDLASLPPPVEQTLFADGTDQPGLRIADSIAVVDQGEQGLLEDVFGVLRGYSVIGEQGFQASPRPLETTLKRRLDLGLVQCTHLPKACQASLPQDTINGRAKSSQPPCSAGADSPRRSPLRGALAIPVRVD